MRYWMKYKRNYIKTFNNTLDLEDRIRITTGNDEELINHNPINRTLKNSNIEIVIVCV